MNTCPTYVQTIHINGFAVKIFYDEFAESPIEMESDFGIHLASAHRKYCLDEELPDDCDNIFQAFQHHLYDKSLSVNDVIYQPIFLYDHSGLAFSTSKFSCRWDSGQFGYIYQSKKAIRNMFGISRISKNVKNKVLNHFETLIKRIEDYSNGNVYRIEIFGIDAEFTNGYSFYGYDHQNSGLEEHAKYCINEHLSTSLVA